MDIEKSKSIVVTGAGGFIAGYLVKRLLAEGYNVRAVDIKSFKKWEQIFPKAKNYRLDLRNFKDARRVCKGASEVYNLATRVGGIKFTETHAADCLSSATININLLQSCIKNNIKKYFHTSSSSVYSGQSPFKESDIETSTPQPGYGEEKTYSEKVCLAFGKTGKIQTRIARPVNVYGPHMIWAPGRSQVPVDLCRKIILSKGKIPIEIWGDGKQSRDFIYVNDVVEGVLRVMESDYDQPINLGNGVNISINDLINTIQEIAGYKVQIKNKMDEYVGPNHKAADITLMKEKLKWQPQTSIKQGMKSLYDWTKEKLAREGKKTNKSFTF